MESLVNMKMTLKNNWDSFRCSVHPTKTCHFMYVLNGFDKL